MPGGGGQERGRRPWIPGARPGEDPREIGERLRASGVLPGGGGSRVAEEAGRSPGSAGLGVGEEERGGPCDVSRSELQEPRQGPGGAERDPEIGSGRELQHLERRRRRRRRLGLARPAIGTSAHSGPQAPARAQSLPGPSMARAAALRPSRSLPVPTLPLLPLFLMLLREAGAQDVEVRVPPEVQGRLGSTVELPCHLLSPTSDVRVRVSQVMWMRQVTSKTSQNLAIFHPTYGPSFPSSKPGQERLWFVMAGQKAGSGPGPAAPEQWEPELRDATLALSGLTVEDEGNYTCEFATFPWGTSRGVTWLRAIAEPRNHAEKQEVTLSLDPLPVARCVSTGGRPPARITWLSTLDGDSTESQTAGPEPGTFTVTSRFTVVPLGRVDGATVTCKVEHESFEEPALLSVTLSVRYPPEVSISGYDDNWYIGRAEASLHCDVRSNPEPTGYDWSTVSGVFPASALARGSQLIIHSVDRLVNTTFICTVTNAVGTGRAELPVLVRDTPRASPQEVGPVVWGAVGGTLLVLLLLAGGVMAFILLRVKRRRKSPGGSAGGGGGGGGGGPGGAGDGADRGSYEAKTQVFGNGGPAFWTPTGPGARRPDGKDDDEEEEEDEKAEVGLMLPPVSLDDDMESQLDGSLISRRAVYV